MLGIASEGLAYYWWLTGDKETLDTIKLIADYQLTDKGKKGTVANSACDLALMYRQTGDEKYRAAALELLKPHQEDRPKGFGQSWRSTAYAWYYLSNLGEKKEKQEK
jgi:rhamnogalacturonyl hydrolase YesR